MELKNRLPKDQAIDKEEQEAMTEESKKWREILTNMFVIIKFLAKQIWSSAATGKLAEGKCNMIVSKLEADRLDIMNCRGLALDINRSRLNK